MEYQEQDFHERQLFGQEDVEQASEGDYSNDKQSTMPSLEDVVGIVEDEETLYLHTGLESGRDYCDLPSQGTEPAKAEYDQLWPLRTPLA